MKSNRLIILTVLVTTIIFDIYAFKFQPITMDFKDEGKNSSQNFQILNTTTETIAVQIEVFKRGMDLNGKDILSETEDFFIYPEQIILKSGKSQTIRVMYKGKKISSKEEAYRIIANQVPVNFDKTKKGGLKILFRYIGSIYVIPENINIDVQITDIEKIDNSMKLHIKNLGNSHVILKDAYIKLKSGSSEVIISSEKLKGLSGSNILAGTTLEYIVPWPKELENENIKGVLHYEEVR